MQKSGKSVTGEMMACHMWAYCSQGHMKHKNHIPIRIHYTILVNTIQSEASDTIAHTLLDHNRSDSVSTAGPAMVDTVCPQLVQCWSIQCPQLVLSSVNQVWAMKEPISFATCGTDMDQ